MANKIKRGFTLIELLMVIVIIAVLVAIALPKYIDTIDIALGKRAYDSMQMIYAAQLRFAADNKGQFASNFNALDVKFPSATVDSHALNYMNFGNKFYVIIGGTTITSQGLPNYTITFDLANETKTCTVVSNANTTKGARVCRALGGEATSTNGVYNLR